MGKSPSASLFNSVVSIRNPRHLISDCSVRLNRKTEHNKLKLFTGWFDAPLAREGREEARRAGKLLRAHG